MKTDFKSHAANSGPCPIACRRHLPCCKAGFSTARTLCTLSPAPATACHSLHEGPVTCVSTTAPSDCSRISEIKMRRLAVSSTRLRLDSTRNTKGTNIDASSRFEHARGTSTVLSLLEAGQTTRFALDVLYQRRDDLEHPATFLSRTTELVAVMGGRVEVGIEST